MKKRWSLTLVIVVLIFLFGGYYVYEHYLKEKIKNVTPKELKINLKDDKVNYILVKHPEQHSVFQLELELSGTSNEFVTLYLGEKPHLFNTSIRLKDGVISTAHISDWYQDTAYVMVEKSPDASGEIRISYQFLSLK